MNPFSKVQGGKLELKEIPPTISTRAVYSRNLNKPYHSRIVKIKINQGYIFWPARKILPPSKILPFLWNLLRYLSFIKVFQHVFYHSFLIFFFSPLFLSFFSSPPSNSSLFLDKKYIYPCFFTYKNVV